MNFGINRICSSLKTSLGKLFLAVTVNLIVFRSAVLDILGEPATLKCDIPKYISSKVYWYRQSVGDTLKLIVRLYRDTEPVYASLFLKSRFSAKNANNFGKLTILETIKEDEGIYHCGTTAWYNLEWSGTYLLETLKGHQTILLYNTATLQCSVLSDSQNKTCPGVNNVFWFRAGSNKSHPNIIYTDGNRTDQCEKRSEHQKRCFYQLKNVSSSDAGTYYCAVATCGEILLGNGTKLNMQAPVNDQKTQQVLNVNIILINMNLNKLKVKSFDIF
uniref:Ig-like domain-containing protein n=1 Tax=Maylandia zebra TaxID=106582 RepID=A0A3P9CPE7_9CICH